MMRPSSRGGPPLPPQTSIFFMISCLASLYVVGRLWTARLEAAHLKDEIAALAAVAAEQRALLRQADAAIKELSVQEGPLFFSVRPNPPKEIPPLSGALLDAGKVVPSAADGGGEGAPAAPSDAAAAAAVAQIDFIERGEVRGWACSREAALPGPLAVEIYVDGVRVTTVTAAAAADDLPAAVQEACAAPGDAPGAPPQRFSAALPLLPQAEHTLRAFVVLPSGRLAEAHASPARFVESAVEPDGVETVHRKDAIIVRRNAELAAIWAEMRTQMPWRRAEAAAAAAGSDGDRTPAGDAKRLLALVLVLSDAQDATWRNVARGTWAPGSAAAGEDLRLQLGVAVRFVVFAPLDSRNAALEAEQAKFGDLLVVGAAEAGTSLPRRLLEGLAAAVADPALDADFFAFTRDRVTVDPAALAAALAGRAGQGNAYLGCMKSGEVIEDTASAWHEPEAERFGAAAGDKSKRQYPVHAAKEFFVVAGPVGRHLARSRWVLHPYRFEDTSMGAWLLGLDVAVASDKRFCCDATKACGGAQPAGQRCVAYQDSRCAGVCDAATARRIYDECVNVGGAGGGGGAAAAG